MAAAARRLRQLLGQLLPEATAAAATSQRQLYHVLGLQPGASPAEVKKAYRKRALESHPDKGGSPEQFRQVSRAHAILSDERKRALYDEQGDASLEEIEALTDARAAPVSEEPVEPVAARIRVPLRLLHVGGKHSLLLPRLRVCGSCKGLQSSKGVCQQCRGRGQQTVAMGTLRLQVACEFCRGTGRLLCRGCAGRGVQEEEAEVKVDVPPGPSGQRLILKGQGHKLPGREQGDVVLLVTAAPDERFSLVNEESGDLAADLAVPLAVALCGGSVPLGQHLDGRQLKVQLDPVVSPGDIVTIPGEGTWSRRGGRGALLLRTRVDFPKKALSGRQGRALQRALQAWGKEATGPEVKGKWTDVKAKRFSHRASL